MMCNVCGHTVEVPYNNSLKAVHCDTVDWETKPEKCNDHGVFETKTVTYAMEFDEG